MVFYSKKSSQLKWKVSNFVVNVKNIDFGLASAVRGLKKEV
jgi:hypothetical protein